MSAALLAALDTHDAAQKRQADQAALRVEYIGLLQNADPAKAARLREVANAIGGDVRADLAALAARTAAAPPPPAPDFSKMRGDQLIAYGVAQQEAARPKAPPLIVPPFNPATASSAQLLRKGLAETPARYPQGGLVDG